MSATTTENTMTIEDLRRAIATAKSTEQSLYRELDQLPQRIKEASRRVIQERSEEARSGTDYGAVMAEDDVDDLRRREGEIRKELWGSKVRRASLNRDLGHAEEQQARASMPEAEAELREAKEAYERAHARQGEALQAVNGAQRRGDVARQKRREAEKELARLEEEYPDGK